MSEPFDPFSGQSVPAVSYEDVPVGTKIVMHVTKPADWVQSVDYSTREPAFWPANADGTRNPKMAAVVTGTVNGELRAQWAPYTSKKATDNKFAAIRDAQVRAGAKIAPGGVLTVWQTGTVPSSNGKPRKTYAAEYVPPGPGSIGDPFAGQSAATPPSAPAAPAQPAVSAPAAPPASVPTADAISALKTKLSGYRAAGLSNAQIAGIPNLTGPDGAQLTADAVAAILA